MHTITIIQQCEGRYDVLINGFSYLVNRGLDETAAIERAEVMKQQFRQLGQRSRIVRA